MNHNQDSDERGTPSTANGSEVHSRLVPLDPVTLPMVRRVKFYTQKGRNPVSEEKKYQDSEVKKIETPDVQSADVWSLSRVVL